MKRMICFSFFLILYGASISVVAKQSAPKIIDDAFPPFVQNEIASIYKNFSAIRHNGDSQNVETKGDIFLEQTERESFRKRLSEQFNQFLTEEIKTIYPDDTERKFAKPKFYIPLSRFNWQFDILPKSFVSELSEIDRWVTPLSKGIDKNGQVSWNKEFRNSPLRVATIRILDQTKQSQLFDACGLSPNIEITWDSKNKRDEVTLNVDYRLGLETPKIKSSLYVILKYLQAEWIKYDRQGFEWTYASGDTVGISDLLQKMAEPSKMDGKSHYAGLILCADRNQLRDYNASIKTYNETYQPKYPLKYKRFPKDMEPVLVLSNRIYKTASDIEDQVTSMDKPSSQSHSKWDSFVDKVLQKNESQLKGFDILQKVVKKEMTCDEACNQVRNDGQYFAGKASDHPERNSEGLLPDDNQKHNRCVSQCHLQTNDQEEISFENAQKRRSMCNSFIKKHRSSLWRDTIQQLDALLQYDIDANRLVSEYRNKGCVGTDYNYLSSVAQLNNIRTQLIQNNAAEDYISGIYCDFDTEGVITSELISFKKDSELFVYYKDINNISKLKSELNEKCPDAARALSN